MGWKFKKATVELDADDWFLIDQALSDARHEADAAGYPADAERMDDLMGRIRAQAADRVRPKRRSS